MDPVQQTDLHAEHAAMVLWETQLNTQEQIAHSTTSDPLEIQGTEMTGNVTSAEI